MRINFSVKYADGSAADATATVADQVAFEQQTDRSIARLADDFRLTDACWLAWHSSKRTGNTHLDFDAWLATVDSVEIGQGRIVPLEGTITPTGS